MKKSKFSGSEIIVMFKQAEAGVPIAELCREHGSRLSRSHFSTTC